MLVQNCIERTQHGAGLDAMASGADPEVNVWVGDGEIFEEVVRHHGFVVLAGVDDDVFDVRLGEEGLSDRAQLDELRPTTLSTFTSWCPFETVGGDGRRASWNPADWSITLINRRAGVHQFW